MTLFAFVKTNSNIFIFYLTVFILWLACGIIKNMQFNKHLCIFAALLFTSLFLAWFNKKRILREHLATNLKKYLMNAFWMLKPQTKLGYRLTLFYVIVTLLLFILVNQYSWHYSLQYLINIQFSTHENLLNTVAAPIYEEIFFRGIFLSCLLNTYPKLKDNVHKICYINALVFWLFHAPLSTQLWLSSLAEFSVPLSLGSFILGYFCTFICLKDQSVVFSVMLHIAANGLGAVWQGIIQNKTIYSLFYY